MSIRTRTIQKLVRRPAEEDEYDDFAFTGLHMLVAGLFLASGAETALGERRGEFRDPDALRWAPLAAAPLAAAAHVVRAMAPGRATRVTSQIMNGVAVAVGAAGLAGSIVSAITSEPGGLFRRRSRTVRERIPSFAPLAFGVTGVLGALLERREQEEAALLDRLEHRARIVERLTPRRRAKLDRIVVHV
jgi:hypothetical protein